MAEPVETEIDFRPFFDLTIGVVFVLLILVSAQIFISLQIRTSEDEQNKLTKARQEQEQFEKAYQADLSRFYEHLEKEAASRNVSLVIDKTQIALRIAAPSKPSGPTQVGDLLVATLSCIAEPQARPKTCPEYTVLRLQDAAFSLETPQNGTDQLGLDGQARLQSSIAFANLVQARPELFSLRTAKGSLAFRHDTDRDSAVFSAMPSSLINNAMIVRLKF